jgi:hypothetical protein
MSAPAESQTPGTRRVLTDRDAERLYSKISDSHKALRGDIEDVETKLEQHLILCADFNAKIGKDVAFLVDAETKRQQAAARDDEFKGRLKTLRPWILGIIVSGAALVAGVIGGKVANGQAPAPEKVETHGTNPTGTSR